MATSVSSKGTNDIPLNKASANSARPMFLDKSISIAKNVLLFVAGAVFFPVVSIMHAIYEYRDPLVPDSSTRVLILNVVRAFLIPIPILGGIIHISGQILHRYKEDSIFAEPKNASFLTSTLVSIPFVGAGTIALCLKNNTLDDA